MGGVLGDQQEGDRYTGEPCVCHRCAATRDKYLETDNLQPKTMKLMRARIETYAAGVNLRGSRKDNGLSNGTPTAEMFDQDQVPA